MNPKPTLQSHPHECLLEILPYVPLPECVFLRSSCSSLKFAVDEHFRTGVKTLPVLLSARYSRKSINQYNQYYKKKIVDGENFNNVEISFGSTSGVMQWKMWEKKKIFYGQKEHFRHENFLVLLDKAKFGSFFAFITKYLPGLTKLALLIDHEDHLNLTNVRDILDHYQKQLKVLLLERTHRSMKVWENIAICKAGEYKFQERVGQTGLMPFLFHHIGQLKALEELYFFPRSSAIPGYHGDYTEDDNLFVDIMSSKLRVFHINYIRDLNYEPFEPETYENVVELGCYSLANTGIRFNDDGHRFPNLKKLVHFINILQGKELIGKTEYMPKLEELHLKMEVTIQSELLTVLNEFQNLKKIYAPDINFFLMMLPDDKDEEGKEAIVNRSVELIELDILTSVNVVTHCFSYFKALKKVIVREPFIEITESDLQNPEFVLSLERFLSPGKPLSIIMKEHNY